MAKTTLPKIYRYPKRRQQDLTRIHRLSPAQEKEGLTGFVQGKEASDLEERAVKGIGKTGYGVYFQLPIPVGIPGEAKELDILVPSYNPQPINIHGWIGHHTQEQNGKDELRDYIIDDYGMEFGWLPIITWRDENLSNQELADAIARKVLQ